jgi:ADP-ribose pyrophosphatase YjhB (NUDIX family)
MPGGQVEIGEDPRDGLRREVREEPGCDIEIGRLFGVYSNLTVGLVILAFRCSYAGGPVRAGMECTDAAWYEPDAAAAAAAGTPAADRIRDGLATSAAVVFRSYTRDESGAYRIVAEGLI